MQMSRWGQVEFFFVLLLRCIRRRKEAHSSINGALADGALRAEKEVNSLRCQQQQHEKRCLLFGPVVVQQAAPPSGFSAKLGPSGHKPPLRKQLVSRGLCGRSVAHLPFQVRVWSSQLRPSDHGALYTDNNYLHFLKLTN